MARNLVARQLLRLFRLVEDTAPQLGGGLDSNGFDIDMGVGDDITLAGSVGGDTVIQRNAGVLEVLAGGSGVGITLVTGGGLVLNFGGPAAGDLIYGTNVGGSVVRLPIGDPGEVLQVNPAGTAPEWGGTWAAYTPTNTNVTVGNGTQVARWSRLGDTVHVFYSLTFGNSTSFGGIPSFGLPVAARNNDATVGGSAWLSDNGTREFIGSTRNGSTASNVRILHTETGGGGNVNATSPFTWTTGDIITFGLTYEAA